MRNKAKKTRHRGQKIHPIWFIGLGAVLLIAVGALIAMRWNTGNEQEQPSKSTPTTLTPHSSSGNISQGWHITTYYTAVEQYHHGPTTTVRGCPARDCANGNTDLGSYPKDFIEKVKNEGAGRITSGAKAGRYLNWSYDAGYWLDNIPSDTNGNTLKPFVSAAADDTALAQNTTFQLVDCGAGQSTIGQSTCDRLRAANWKIVDRFTPGLGGPKHIDLYIGEENQDNFENSDLFTDLSNVSLQL